MFDVSVEDYLWTFLTGGCLCIPSENGLKNKLPGVVKELHVNRIGMTPSLARMYRAEDIPTVKAIILGGEPLSRVDVQMWADKVRLVNSYGPTKCSVSCISTDMSAHSDPTNVGQMHGAAAWIVNKDDHDRLVSPGAPGELLLEGHTLARGYLGEPKKTAAAFVNSPQWLRELRPESRVYKTGDLVQYDVDRSIRYIGRKDTQVKIRGQRVELGEIENQIHQASSSAVYDVIVELISTAGGRQTGPILAAFVRGSPTTAFGDDQEVVCKAKRSAMFGHGSPTQRAESQRIVQILAKRLPSYMVPSIFIPLTYVPVSPSGKADRRFLREQAAALSRQELEMYFTCNVTKRPPKTSSEQTLQAIVAEVLLLEANEVGMDDDFFQLGGDSIITTRLVLRAREASFSFRVTDVFRTPKLSDMASIRAGESIERATDTGLSSAHYLGFSGKDDTIGRDLSSRPCFFSKENVSDILPVTHFAEQMLFQSPEYWGDTLRGPIDYSRLQWACAELFQRHEILRTVFLPFRNQFVQVILDHFDTRIQHLGFMDSLDGFLDQHRREDQVSLRTIDKLVTRFTFVQGPQESGILVLRLSHAQFDGYSLRTLWHDLQYLYGGASLPPAANLSSHIQEWARVQEQEEAFDFWKDVLAGSTPTRIDNKTFRDDNITNHLPARIIEPTCRVHPGTAIPHSITAATLSKAAWAFLLARLTGQDNVVFAQISNGRSHASPDAHHVVGMCLAQVPVCIQLNPAWTALDLMEFVLQQHRDSLLYELLDFRQTVDRSTPWPEGIMYQSNVLHQNIEPDLPFPIGGTRASITCSYEWPDPPYEMLIESRPLPDGDFQLTMLVSSTIWSEVHAESVVEKLSRLITAFSTSPHEPLSRLVV